MLLDRVAIAQTQEAHLCVIKVGLDDIDMSTMRGREKREQLQSSLHVYTEKDREWEEERDDCDQTIIM